MSLCFILVIYTFFAFYFQCGYSIYDVESDDLPYQYAYHVNTTTNSIEECEYCQVSICKGSYCFKADDMLHLPFIEIPINTNTSLLNNNSEHQKNKVNRYILEPYIFYLDTYMVDEITMECTKDSHCFTNKCVDTRCAFNENGDIKLCIDGHCGRFVGDPCTTGDECAKGYCDEECIFPKQPERETNTKHNLEFFGILGFLIIIVFIVFCMLVITLILKLVILNLINNLLVLIKH